MTLVSGYDNINYIKSAVVSAMLKKEKVAEMEKIKILVVDDDEQICELTKSFLSRREYSIFTALTPENAIELTKLELPQIILLDIRLGGASGLEVLRKIKQIDEKIKVIMVTALNDEENIQQAKSLGADDYIIKPFTTSYLNDLILRKIAVLEVGEK